ncbi:hypothetical protein [Flavobacterium sp. HTF]|uniref:hypothetical protein n=1 Tax=Flavobacterium sp. HTF TaxID=2170732 RepID=UPI000D5C8CEF|nr:hypothetical protein [Flavobacterium sp. HTF]PWB24244.1 hypothetical protein DCO46_12535 [Flavobacterium sp. HTF]
MTQFKRLTVSIFILILSQISISQNKETYLKKVCYTENFLKTKTDSICFLTTINNSNLPKPTILFIQGSKPLPLIFYDDKEVNTIIPFDIKPYLKKYNFVVIARKGIPLIGSYEKDSNGYRKADGKIPEDYIKNDNLNYRVNQVKSVIAFLHKNNTVKKDSIFVVGHSEGYRVAAKAAENNNKISKLVCMSADPFNRITESILRERIECFKNDDDATSQNKIDKLISEYTNIEKDSKEFKNDIDFNNWASYNRHLSYESFKKFKNPMLIIYGTNDIGSTHNDLLPFLLPYKKITIKAYPDYGHNYEKREFDSNGKELESSYHWDDVFKDVTNWLLQKN